MDQAQWDARVDAHWAALMARRPLPKPHGYLHRTFEYVPARRQTDDDWAYVETRIAFDYRPGTERSHPGGHWTSGSGSYDPPDAAEAEFLGAERQDGDKWLPIPATDWLHSWCRAAYDAADEDDFFRALPARDDAP